MSNTLTLSYPTPLEGQEFLTETDPSALKKLVNNDSSSDIGSEISRVTEIVFDLNRCDKALSQAESILKILHGKYSSLSNSLRDYSLDSINQSESIDELMHDLTREMSFACKAYLMQLNANNKWVFGLPKKSAFGVNYAIHYLSLLKTEHYILDKSIPSYLWQELFQLYQFAEVNKLVSIKVKDHSDNRIGVSVNILSSFSRAALIASMEPFFLSREETWNLFHYLNYVVTDNQISADESIVKEAHCFGFNFQNAQRPKLVKEQAAHDSNSRYLNIVPFTTKVKKELKAFNSNKPQTFEFLSTNDRGLQEKLLQLMYRYSVQYITRESDRYPVEVEAKVLWGYSDILQLLKNELNLSKHPSDAEMSSIEAMSTNELPISWQTVNESQGGACIQEQQYKGLKVADGTPLVISKELPNNQGRWQMAISRWHNSNNTTDKVGIKYVKGELQLAKVANKDSEDFIFIGPDNRKRYFLLTPKGALNGSKNLILELSDSKALVNKKGIFPCHHAELIQFELVKTSD